MTREGLPRSIAVGVVRLPGLEFEVHQLDSGETVIPEGDMVRIFEWLGRYSLSRTTEAVEALAQALRGTEMEGARQ
jgi:hypothetical protein